LLRPISVNKTLEKEFILFEKTIIYKAFRLRKNFVSIIYKNFKKFIIKSIIKH